MRLDFEMMKEVRRLAATGHWSQRRIARFFGIARSTVQNVILGRCTLRVRQSEDDQTLLFDPAVSPPQRCSGCGGKVYMPCHLCHVRQLKRHAPRMARLKAAS